MRILLECDGPLASVLSATPIARDLAARGHDVWVKSLYSQVFGDDPRIFTYDPDYYSSVTFDRELQLDKNDEAVKTFLRQTIGTAPSKPEVFITGTRGFAGSYIAAYLRKCDYPIHYHSRRAGDLTTSRCFPREIVIHCAAAAGPWYSAERIARDNIAATARLVAQAKEYGTKLFIFLSSTSVYGTTQGLVDEKYAPLNPNTYGLSKLIGEQLIKEAEFPTALCLRCPGIIGPNARGTNWPVRMAKDFRASGETQVYNAAQLFNNLVHIHDVAAFIENAIRFRKDFFGPSVFNLCANDPITIRAAAALFGEKLLGYEPTLNEVVSAAAPFLLSNELAKMVGWKPMTVTDSLIRYAQELRA